MKPSITLVLITAVVAASPAAALTRFCSPEATLVIANNKVDFQPRTISARDVGISQRALDHSTAFVVAMAYHSKSVLFVPDMRDRYTIATLPAEYPAWTGWRDCSP